MINGQESKEFIGLAVPASLKATIERLAKTEGLSISAWVRHNLILMLRQLEKAKSGKTSD